MHNDLYTCTQVICWHTIVFIRFHWEEFYCCGMNRSYSFAKCTVFCPQLMTHTHTIHETSWWYHRGWAKSSGRSLCSKYVQPTHFRNQKGILWSMINWLVVSTPLKNMKVSWVYSSQYMGKNVPNHQPDKFWCVSPNDHPAGERTSKCPGETMLNDLFMPSPNEAPLKRGQDRAHMLKIVSECFRYSKSNFMFINIHQFPFWAMEKDIDTRRLVPHSILPGLDAASRARRMNVITEATSGCRSNPVTQRDTKERWTGWWLTYPSGKY